MAREGGKPDEFVKLYGALGNEIARQKALLESFDIVPTKAPEVGALPRGAIYLAFDITLAGPYLSRDDRAFHLIADNPVRREWAFWVPMVASSTWKGNVRAAAVTLAESEQNKEQWAGRVTELFGPRQAEDEQTQEEWEARKGRVQFLPTYFDRAEADVINPRSRTTRKGTQPILMERVPTGVKGRIGMLYVPFDLLHRRDLEQEKAKDLRLLGTAMASMLRESGFGGKKTQPNYGTGEDRIENVVLADDQGGIPIELTSAAELWQLPAGARRRA